MTTFNKSYDFGIDIAALDQAPIVIQGSRAKAIVLLATCLFFAALGLFAILRGEDDGLSVGFPTALIFGLGLLVAAVNVARPSVMTITTRDVTVKTILRTWSVRWDQIQDVFVYRTRTSGPSAGFSQGVEMAAFKWKTTPNAPRRGRRIGFALGADGGFGPGWPLSAQQMTDLLNAARTRGTSTPP